MVGLTLIPAWISNHMASKLWDEITHPFQNFNVCTVEVWECIGNFIPHLIMDIIIHPCWDLNQTMSVKGAPGPGHNNFICVHLLVHVLWLNPLDMWDNVQWTTFTGSNVSWLKTTHHMITLTHQIISLMKNKEVLGLLNITWNKITFRRIILEFEWKENWVDFYPKSCQNVLVTTGLLIPHAYNTCSDWDNHHL